MPCRVVMYRFAMLHVVAVLIDNLLENDDSSYVRHYYQYIQSYIYLMYNVAYELDIIWLFVICIWFHTYIFMCISSSHVFRIYIKNYTYKHIINQVVFVDLLIKLRVYCSSCSTSYMLAWAWMNVCLCYIHESSFIVTSWMGLGFMLQLHRKLWKSLEWFPSYYPT